MKKLILISMIVFLAAITYGQSPVDVGRVATATTDFTVNIPVGKLVYCVATEKYYYCKTATASGSDLTDAAANFVEIGTATESDPIWISDSATYAAKSWVLDQGFLTSESDPVWISDSSTYLSKSVAAETYQLVSDTSDNDATRYWVGQQAFIQDGDFTSNGIMVRTSAGNYTNRSVAGTANEVTVTNGDGVSGNPTISLVVNKDLVAGSGLTGGADNILIGADADVTLKADTTLLSTQYYVNSQGFLTSEVDGSITNEGSLSVGAGAANTSLIQSNTSGSADITLSGGSNITVTESSNTITIAATGLEPTLSKGNLTEATSNHLTISGGTGAVIGSGTSLQVNTGIADNKLLEVDDADAADNDFAKFTASGIEGRSYSEVREDLTIRRITEKFEEDDGTPTAHTLTGTPTGGEAGCLVMLNGTPLTTDQFVQSGTSLTIGITVYQYDVVTITYEY